MYKTDIMGIGLNNIKIRDRYTEDGRFIIDDHTLDEIHHLLTHPGEKKRIVKENFEIAR